MGIQICSNKGAGSLWGPIRGKIRKSLINLQKSSKKLIVIIIVKSLKKILLKNCSTKWDNI